MAETSSSVPVIHSPRKTVLTEAAIVARIASTTAHCSYRYKSNAVTSSSAVTNTSARP